MRRAFLLYPFVVGWMCLAGPSHAQSIRDTVERHVDENLTKDPPTKDSPEKKPDEAARETSPEDEPKKEKKGKKETAEERRRREQREAEERRRRDELRQKERAELRARIDEMEAARKERNRGLPKRVLPKKWISLDPQVSGGYRGWLPDQYPGLDVKVQNFFQWSVGMRGRFFKLFRIYRAAYTSAGLSSPRSSKGAAIAEKAAKAGPNVAAKALGFIGIEVNYPIIPMVRYSTRAYEMTARPQQPVRVVPFDSSADAQVEDLPFTQEPLSALSAYENFVAGIRSNPKRERTPEQVERNPNPLPWYLGVSLMRYAKPYQVRVGSATLDELVFDGRFRGAGLSAGFSLPRGLEKLGLSVEGDVGLGEIRLTRDLKLNDVLPSDWLMGYARGSVELSYNYPLLRTKPTLLIQPSASATGATFFYFNTSPNEEDVEEAPLANWDVFWAANVRLVLPL